MNRTQNNDRIRVIVQRHCDQDRTIPAAEVTALTIELIGLADELVETALAEGYAAAESVSGR